MAPLAGVADFGLRCDLCLRGIHFPVVVVVSPVLAIVRCVVDGGDKTGTLTLNKLSVDTSLIEVFVKGVEKEYFLLLAARASRTENQDAIDAAMVGMLADAKEARDGIREVHFFPFNPVDKRTALTCIDSNGNWHRASKGVPEQILALCRCKEDVKRKAHSIIDNYAERGLRSLAIARREVPEKKKKVQEVRGSLLVYCPYLILPDMTVQKQSGEL